MSSKRRQETIAQFSIPLDAGDGALSMDTSDEEFLGKDDDDYVFPRNVDGEKTSRNKSKGKGHASAHPKVMLLSLKAVCFSYVSRLI